MDLAGGRKRVDRDAREGGHEWSTTLCALVFSASCCKDGGEKDNILSRRKDRDREEGRNKTLKRKGKKRGGKKGKWL